MCSEIINQDNDLKGEDAAQKFKKIQRRIRLLNEAFLRTIRTDADSYMIYADINALDEATMKRHHITFKKIPRDIARL